MVELAKDAMEKSVRHVSWHVFTYNEAARKFYERVCSAIQIAEVESVFLGFQLGARDLTEVEEQRKYGMDEKALRELAEA